MKIQVGVIGPAEEEYSSDKKMREKIEITAERLGELVAESGAVLFTGGMSGVMEAASRGAKKKGGLTIGTPGRDRGISNKYVDVEICTPIDIGDFLFAGTWSCDAIIVVPGSAGTLAEMCLAYRAKKPIIVLRGFDEIYEKWIDNYIDEGKFVKILGTETPEEAVEMAIKIAKLNLNKK
ncbi:MAG: LOG family protein [Candidatus Aenigmarchaeota archaeon]|nr:LOG family protein [Candidatus Aenigmarchaeota archaeon]